MVVAVIDGVVGVSLAVVVDDVNDVGRVNAVIGVVAVF